MTHAVRRREEAARALGWQANGSMLLARDAEGAAALEAQAAGLRGRGVETHLMTAAQAVAQEPSLCVPQDGAALALPSDVQVDGRSAAAALLQQCRVRDAQPAPTHSPRASSLPGPA